MLLVSASASVSDVNIEIAPSDVLEIVQDGKSVSGFMVFVGLLTLLSEIALVIIRFLNFGGINRFFLTFVLVVSKTLSKAVLCFSNNVHELHITFLVTCTIDWYISLRR